MRRRDRHLVDGHALLGRDGGGVERTRVDRSGVDGGRASASRAAAASLWARAGRVGAAVLAMRDAQVSVVRLGLDAVDGLDGVRDVRKVDERAVPSDGEVSIEVYWRDDR